MAILGILLTLAFGAFRMSSRIFQDTTTRQSAEIQLRTIKILAERDIELSNFWNIKHYPRTTTDGERDAVVFNSLSDWVPPGNFDPATGRPAWDRYVLWYATQQNPGRLIRQLIAPPLNSGTFLDSPYPAPSASNFSDGNPDSNEDAIYTRVLSEDVLDFQVNPKLQNGSLEFRIRLRSLGLQRQGSSDRTEENLEVNVTFVPRNTWPAI